MLPVVATIERTAVEIIVYTAAAGGHDAALRRRWRTWAPLPGRRPSCSAPCSSSTPCACTGSGPPQRRDRPVPLLDHLPDAAVRRHGGRRPGPPALSAVRRRRRLDLGRRRPRSAAVWSASWRRTAGWRAPVPGPVASPAGPGSVAERRWRSSARPRPPVGADRAITFFASWCSPCRTELPMIARVASRRGRIGGAVSFVGIDGNDDPASGLAFARASGVTFPVGEDPASAVAPRFGLIGYPGHRVRRRQGRRRRDRARAHLGGDAAPWVAAARHRPTPGRRARASVQGPGDGAGRRRRRGSMRRRRPRRPGRSSQVPIPTTGVPATRARAISDSVP